MKNDPQVWIHFAVWSPLRRSEPVSFCRHHISGVRVLRQFDLPTVCNTLVIRHIQQSIVRVSSKRVSREQLRDVVHVVDDRTLVTDAIESSQP
jgi:hypothetical protein